jgi:formyl-CoA transferase
LACSRRYYFTGYNAPALGTGEGEERPVVSGPLQGIHVLEFSLIVAGPYCGVNLSDLGADVVKVEPLAGEAYRSSAAVVPSEGKRFQSLNRGKRSICVDLASERGRELIYRIVPRFDVVVANYGPGVSTRLGVDYASLRGLREDLIYVDISGFGKQGPLGSLTATDLVAAAYTGMLAGNANVNADGEPVQMTPAVADYTTALASSMAVCAALFHRERTGEGQLIEASLLQSALSLQDAYVMREPVSDSVIRDPYMRQVEEMRARGASYAEQIAERGKYRAHGGGPPRLYYAAYVCKDGALAIGCLTTTSRAAARKVLGIEDDYSDSPDFDINDPANEPRIASWKAEIRRKMRERTVAEWVADFRAADCPVAPVQFPEELGDDPQVEAMGLMRDLEHSVTGPQRVPGPIVRMSVTPPEAQRAAPALAEHTDEVLAEAGLTSEEIAALRADDVIR